MYCKLTFSNFMGILIFKKKKIILNEVTWIIKNSKWSINELNWFLAESTKSIYESFINQPPTDSSKYVALQDLFSSSAAESPSHVHFDFHDGAEPLQCRYVVISSNLFLYILSKNTL